MGVDEQAKAVFEAAVKVHDKAMGIMELASNVGFTVDGITLTADQKKQILALYQTKKAELVALVEALP